MSNPVVESAGYTNLSASALVRTGAGQLLGVFCASSSAGTLKLWDNTSAATTVIINTFALTGAGFYPTPINFKTGLFATIGGTADITLIWNPVN